VTAASLPLLEALCDSRIGALPAVEVRDLDPDLLELEGDMARLRPGGRAGAGEVVAKAVRERAIEWASRSTTQGEVLDEFAHHCRDELDEIELSASAPTALEVAWRRERATVELRAGLVGWERLSAERPVIVLGPLDDALAERFAAEAPLRERIVVYDLVTLNKAGAVRGSAPVFLEWFLRDAYGVKVLAAPAFTQGLVARGVISLGMG
jgi:hypothetical protein